MNPFRIPIEFILRRIPLSWAETLWGYEHQWLGWSSLVDLALEKLSSEPVNHPLEVELASLDKDGSWRAGEIVRELAAQEKDDGQESAAKWLYILLSWIFDHKDDYTDPLEIVEEVYADFGYPSEIQPFVRFMPETSSYDPLEHTPEENQTRLFARWQHYLEESKERFQSETH